MIVTIKFPVNGVVFYSKIGAQIDHARAGGQERLGEFSRKSVRQCQENKSGLSCDLVWVRIGKLESDRSLVVHETRKNLGQRLAGPLPRRCRGKIDMWMREEQTHQFLAGITGSAHHRDLRSFHNAQCVFRLARIATKSC